MHAIGVLILIAYLGGNTYIYIRGLSFLKKRTRGFRIFYTIAYWLFALLFLVSLSLRNMLLPEWIGHWMYQVGHAWLVFTLYMIPLLVLCDVIRLFIPSFKRAFSVSFILTLLVMGYGYYNYLHPIVTTVDIAIDKPLNADRKDYKVVLLSDVHLGYGRGTKAVEQYVQMVNEQQADLVLIAGDLIDNSAEAVVRLGLGKGLAKMTAGDGVYIVPGNHEYISDIKGTVDFLNTLPFHLLRDEVFVLPNGIQLVGRDDKANPNRASIEELFDNVSLDSPIILLDHQPLETEASEAVGVDLQVSGHTHNGQIWPFSLLTCSLFRVSYGYQRFGDFHLYVSSGLGLWGPPLRIGTKSELVVLNLTFN